MGKYLLSVITQTKQQSN